jgi:chaperonin cofactor prefoldin
VQNIQDQIGRIQGKVQELLKQNNQLHKENLQHRKTIESLQTQKETFEKRIRALEEQQNILKSAAGNLNPAEKKAFENNINRYMREIDKCIALLSE